MTDLMYLSKGNHTLVIATCPICGEQTDLIVPTEDFFRYREGALVQVAFPDRSPEDREIITSGMCRECQQIFFGEE